MRFFIYNTDKQEFYRQWIWIRHNDDDINDTDCVTNVCYMQKINYIHKIISMVSFFVPKTSVVALVLIVSNKKISKEFAIKAHVILLNPGYESNLTMQGYNLCTLGESPLDKASCKNW